MRQSRAVRSAILAVSFAALALPRLLAQQPVGVAPGPRPTPPAEGTAALSGVVRDADTNEPIPGVMVYLGFQGRGAVGRLSRQISDAKGRFVFTDLPAGDLYFINASKFGYMEGHYGVGAGGLLGGLIALADGQWFSQATVTMQRPGSISGRLFDEHGEPAVGAFIRLLARVKVAGATRLAAGPATKTDDRGVYRIPELIPGKYVVQVPQVSSTFSGSMSAAELAGVTAEQIAAGRPIPTPPPSLTLADGTRLIAGGYLPPPPPVNGRPQVYAPLLYPGVTSLESASVIDLKPGEDRTGVDMTLRAVPALSVSGTVQAPTGASVAGTLIRLVPDGFEQLGNGSEAATATLGADGRFSLVNVPAGSYTIDVRRTVAEYQFRSPLSTASATLPAPWSPSVSSGSGSVVAGASGTNYSMRSQQAASAFYAQQKITLGARPLTDVVVVLNLAGTIRGRFQVEADETPTPSSGPAIVWAEPADGNVGNGMYQSLSIPGGAPGEAPPMTFEIPGITPGQYFLRFLSAPISGTVKAIQSDDGVDHRLRPFDMRSGRDYQVVVVMTNKRTDLSGSAADTSGSQVKNAIAIAFPVERDQWTNYGMSPARLRASPTSTSGTYRFQSLPAGDYYVIAVPPDQADVWQDPDKLAQLVPSARRVTLNLGEPAKLDVVVVRLK